MTSLETDDYREKIKKDYSVKLATCLVIPSPWKVVRIEDAVSGIGVRGNAWREDTSNHHADLYLPMGVTIVETGNHSIFCGMLKSQGAVTPGNVYDLTKAYDYIYFDGTYYRHMCCDEIICEAPSFEFGCIFEIGRLISRSKIRFLEDTSFDKLMSLQV